MKRRKEDQVGDKNRITHDYMDTSFMKLLSDFDNGKIKDMDRPFMDRPPYYGTSACPKGTKTCTKQQGK